MIEPLNLDDLNAVSVLGRGAKGVVFQLRAAGRCDLALKAISRSAIEAKAATNSADNNGGDVYRRIWFERDTLLVLDHPLLPTLRGFVSTEKIIGFVIDRCSGGDLSLLRRRQTEKMFSDDVIRFYAAELVLALEYLHGLGFVYRDLKPENVLIQDNGHIMLVDFDLSTRLPSSLPQTIASSPQKSLEIKARKGSSGKLQSCFSCSSSVSLDTDDDNTMSSSSSTWRSSSSSAKSNSFVGTEEYLAPEIIESSGHDFSVDWWGLGVVLYEMLYGVTPFRGANRKETYYRILVKKPELVGERTPLRDLIRRLLEKDPSQRISGSEVKKHDFFKGVDWENVLQVGRPPFIPEIVEDDGMDVLRIDVEKTVEELMLAKAKANEKEDNSEWLSDESKMPNFETF